MNASSRSSRSPTGRGSVSGRAPVEDAEGAGEVVVATNQDKRRSTARVSVRLSVSRSDRRERPGLDGVRTPRLGASSPNAPDLWVKHACSFRSDATRGPRRPWVSILIHGRPASFKSVSRQPRRLAHICPQTAAENAKGGPRISPETASDLLLLLVAGAGFEPATSGL